MHITVQTFASRDGRLCWVFVCRFLGTTKGLLWHNCCEWS